jgi:copper transport protein
MTTERTTARILLLAPLLILVAGWLLVPESAAAHAKLVRTEPEGRALLDASPGEISLYFSEGINLGISQITLLDRSRNEYPVGPLAHIGGDASTMEASLERALPPGTYTVVWQVLSAVDGHVTTGSFAFRVKGTGGEETEPIEPLDGTGGVGDESVPQPDPLRWLSRALIFGALAFLLGGPILALLVVEPTLSSSKDESRGRLWRSLGRRFGRAGAIAAVVLFVALVLDLLLQVATIRGGNLIGALGEGDVGLSVLNSSRYGLTWSLRAVAAFLLLAFMLFIWLFSGRGGSGMWELVIAAASLAMVAQSLGSHAAALTDAGLLGGFPLPIVVDWLHLVTVGTWIGGLGYLALVLYPGMKAEGYTWEERRTLLANAIPRFSRLAVVSVIVLAATGFATVLLRTQDIGALLSSTYGLLLALKIAAYGVLVAIGAINLRRLTPLLQAKVKGNPDEEASKRPVRGLSRNVMLEIGLASVALLLAGGLTLTPPPASSASGAPPNIARNPTPEPTPRPAVAETTVGGYRLQISAQPSLEGDVINLDVERTDPAAPPLTDVVKVLLRITPQEIDAGSASYPAEKRGSDVPGSLQAGLTEQIFTLDGAYLVAVIVQRAEADDLRAAFRLTLEESGALTARADELVDVGILTDPSPPVNGDAQVTVLLTDAEGNPIPDAKVTVNPFMPAHAHIEPVTVAEPVPGDPGAYKTDISFDMGGAWLFIFNVERPGMPPLKVDASLDVEGPEWTPTPKP